MSILNGSDIIIFNATTGDPIACQRGVNVQMNDAMIDATCKEDGGYAHFLAGKREFTITADALVDWQPAINTEGISEFVDAVENRTKLEINISDPENALVYFTGEIFVESIEVNAPMEDVVTYTATLRGTGVIQSLVS